MSTNQRSIYSLEQQWEVESRLYIHSHFNRQGWKFRDLDQDNDIDGEIEVFEPVGDGEQKETSAKFIKIQLKSTGNCNLASGKPQA